jgi:hypothetical protein
MHVIAVFAATIWDWIVLRSPAATVITAAVERA